MNKELLISYHVLYICMEIVLQELNHYLLLIFYYLKTLLFLLLILVDAGNLKGLMSLLGGKKKMTYNAL